MGENTGQTGTEPNTIELLVDLLKRAEQAHGLHEKELGHRDAEWPEWYAAHMTRALRAAGYRIIRASPDGPGERKT